MTPEEAIREAIRQFVASHRTWRQVREIRDAASVDDALPALAELWNCGASGPGTVAWRALGSHMLVSYPSDGRLVDVRLTRAEVARRIRATGSYQQEVLL